MNINYATITVAILFFLVTFSCPQVNGAKSIIPDCMFGVKSVSYVLYTRNDPNGRVVHMQDRQIPIRAGRPVAFFIHGFISQVNGSNYVELIKNWLQKEDISIFSVDWDNAACTGSLHITDPITYGSAVKNVPVVGQDVAKFTQRLAQRFAVKINQIVIVGHSLGAHVSGHAGKTIQRLMKKKFKTIVGLDPAGPLFRGKGCADRLCNTDAGYVLIFHTSRIEGYHDPLGDADFYFHGGTRQPGCILSTKCDHRRAVTYASMAIKQPRCFLGTRWQLDSSNIPSTRQCSPSSCAYAGLDAPQQNVRGIFYVAPTSKEPHCTK